MTSFKVIVLAVLVVAVAAKPQEILEQEFDQKPDGSYSFKFKQDDGTAVEQTGELIPGDEPDTKVAIMEGSFTYTDPEGKVFTVKYVADKDGFKPEGEHIPKRR